MRVPWLDAENDAMNNLRRARREDREGAGAHVTAARVRQNLSGGQNRAKGIPSAQNLPAEHRVPENLIEIDKDDKSVVTQSADPENSRGI